MHFTNEEMNDERRGIYPLISILNSFSGEVETAIQEINRRFGPRTFWQQLVDAPILVRYFLRSMFNNSVSSLSFIIRLRLFLILSMSCFSFKIFLILSRWISLYPFSLGSPARSGVRFLWLS